MYNLEKTTPEKAGISPEKIIGFVEKIKRYKMNIHSFIFVRNEKTVAEAYAKPFFDENFEHRLYSCSKSFVALAIIKLLGENKIKLTDKICDYYPEYVDDNTDELIAETTIEDMLKMAVPMETDSYGMRKDLGWLESFFKVKSSKISGRIFDYNSSSSYVLGCLVEKLTGKTFVDYLRPEFDETGVKNVWCVKSPDGHAWGASGVVCTLRDFARVGVLLLNKGNVNGKQILSKEYIEMATSRQINNYVENNFTPRNAMGYGFQFWVTDEGFSMYGMGSQYMFCFPETNLVFCCNGDTQVDGYDFCGDLLYEWVREINDGISDGLVCGDTDDTELQKVLSEYSLPLSGFDADYGLIEKINGKKYLLEDNDMKIKWVKLIFRGDCGKFVYENERGEKSFDFGVNKFVKGVFPEEDYYSEQVGVPSKRRQNTVAVCECVGKENLLIRAYITDSNFGNLFISLGFKDDAIGVSMKKRAEFFLDDYKGVAHGRLAE